MSTGVLVSDLPLGIIHVILSLVPIRDAVGTSFLSRKWRYMWSSLPHLAFDKNCVNPPIAYGSDEKRLIHFISQTLLFHEGSIHKFQLRLLPMANLQCINQWLLFLSRNGIRNLVLESEGDIGYGTIESIVSHSPLLEELTLECVIYLKITICALNLKYLHFLDAFSDLSLCTPLLQELKGSFSTTTSFSIGVESLVFHYLRTIELYHVPFNNKEVTPAVIRLITGSPNLQKLEIEASFRDDLPKLAYSWDIESAPDFKYNSLKVITINSFGGYTNVLKLIEFLLARSPMLETLMYVSRSSLSNKEIQKLKNQLLSCHCASANAQIVIRHQ